VGFVVLAGGDEVGGQGKYGVQKEEDDGQDNQVVQSLKVQEGGDTHIPDVVHGGAEFQLLFLRGEPTAGAEFPVSIISIFIGYIFMFIFVL
jgi:hypothetical protein